MKAMKILTIVAVALALQVMVASTSLAAPAEQYGCGNNGGSYHVVCKGETLFSLGRMYGVYPYAIAEANGLWNPDLIYAGQVLYIPAGPAWQDPCYAGNPCNGGTVDPCYSADPCGGWGDNANPCYSADPCNGWGNADPCGSPCDTPYQYGYGYDNAGYYYDNYYPGQAYERYSYPCGYNYNCY